MMGFNLFCLLLVFLTQTFAAPPGSPAPELPGQAELLEASIKLSSKNTLEYNQKCSIEDEKKKTALGMKLIDTMSELDFSKMKSIAAELSELANSSKSFCNSLNNLDCGANGVCECGNGEAVGIKMKSIREKDECRLAVGSICVPEESIPKVGAEKMHLKCQEKSECTLKNSTSPCTAGKMQEVLLEGFGGMDKAAKDPKGFMKNTKKMSIEGICFCSSV